MLKRNLTSEPWGLAASNYVSVTSLSLSLSLLSQSQEFPRFFFSLLLTTLSPLSLVRSVRKINYYIFWPLFSIYFFFSFISLILSTYLYMIYIIWYFFLFLFFFSFFLILFLYFFFLFLVKIKIVVKRTGTAFLPKRRGIRW